MENVPTCSPNMFLDVHQHTARRSRRPQRAVCWGTSVCTRVQNAVTRVPQQQYVPLCRLRRWERPGTRVQNAGTRVPGVAQHSQRRGTSVYTCTCALYPGTKSGPMHCGVASYRRRGCSTRWGTSLYPGTKRGYKCSHVFPNVANRLRPRRSTTRPVLQRAFSGVPVYTPYAVARGIW